MSCSCIILVCQVGIWYLLFMFCNWMVQFIQEGTSRSTFTQLKIFPTHLRAGRPNLATTPTGHWTVAYGRYVHLLSVRFQPPHLLRDRRQRDSQILCASCGSSIQYASIRLAFACLGGVSPKLSTTRSSPFCPQQLPYEARGSAKGSTETFSTPTNRRLSGRCLPHFIAFLSEGIKQFA